MFYSYSNSRAVLRQSSEQGARRSIASLYRLITTTRNYLYDKQFLPTYKSTLPIICIGNITVGGTGKTPLCIELVEYLKTKGKKPVVLTRGYKGSLSGPIAINETHTYKEVGDEPLLIYGKTKMPVVVAKQRVEGAKYIESNKLGDIIILDDGFQHRALHRDLNILCINYSSPESIKEFSDNKQLPFGKFREEKKEGLKRADLIVLNSRNLNAVDNKLIEKFKIDEDIEIPVYASNLKASFVGGVNANTNTIKLEDKLVVFCSIANPEGFYKTIEALGFKDFKKVEFPDHYSINQLDLKNLIESNPDAKFVCTEKDWVKIERILASSERKADFFRVEIRVVVEEEFFKRVLTDSHAPVRARLEVAKHSNE